MTADEAAATVRDYIAHWNHERSQRDALAALDVLVAAVQRADEWRKESKLAGALFDHESERADRLAVALAAQMALTAAAYCDPDHLAHKDYIDGMDAARAALVHGRAT